jgi:hypothetical protein
LLGSVSPALVREISESLAGRLALVELTPLLWSELESDPQRARLQTDYLDLLAQRDLPNWGLPVAPATTRRLMHMLAAVHAQTWNASALARSLGIDQKTVNRYVGHLEPS